MLFLYTHIRDCRLRLQISLNIKNVKNFLIIFVKLFKERNIAKHYKWGFRAIFFKRDKL